MTVKLIPFAFICFAADERPSQSICDSPSVKTKISFVAYLA